MLFIKAEDAGILTYFKDDNAEKEQKILAEASSDTLLMLRHTVIHDIADADIQLQKWRDKYNNQRPHEALNMMCPADVYVPSQRIYSDEVKRFEYGGNYHVIKVNSWGYVRFDKWQVYLSDTMIGEYIEFRPNESGEAFSACYRNFKIAEFSTSDGKLLNRRISRL